MYFLATAGSPAGFVEVVQVGVLLQSAGLVEARDSRRDPAVGDVAEDGAAARQAQGVAVDAAMTALRMLRLSNGLIVVFMAM